MTISNQNPLIGEPGYRVVEIRDSDNARRLGEVQYFEHGARLEEESSTAPFILAPWMTGGTYTMVDAGISRRFKTTRGSGGAFHIEFL